MPCDHHRGIATTMHKPVNSFDASAPSARGPVAARRRYALGLVSAGLVLVSLSGAAYPVDLNQRADTQAAAGIEQVLADARKAIDRLDWSEALVILRSAATSHAGNADVQNLLGYSYRMQSQANLPQALAHYREALRLDPSHQGAHEYIGQAYLTLGRPQDAQHHLDILKRLCGGPGCEPHRRLAESLATYRQSGTAPPESGIRYPR